MAKCEYCQEDLGSNRGFVVMGTQGKWKGKPLVLCDAQCMQKWDCGENFDQGHQGFNLAEDLFKMRPRGGLADSLTRLDRLTSDILKSQLF